MSTGKVGHISESEPGSETTTRRAGMQSATKHFLRIDKHNDPRPGCQLTILPARCIVFGLDCSGKEGRGYISRKARLEELRWTLRLGNIEISSMVAQALCRSISQFDASTTTSWSCTWLTVEGSSQKSAIHLVPWPRRSPRHQTQRNNKVLSLKNSQSSGTGNKSQRPPDKLF